MRNGARFTFSPSVARKETTSTSVERSFDCENCSSSGREGTVQSLRRTLSGKPRDGNQEWPPGSSARVSAGGRRRARTVHSRTHAEVPPPDRFGGEADQETRWSLTRRLLERTSSSARSRAGARPSLDHGAPRLSGGLTRSAPRYDARRRSLGGVAAFFPPCETRGAWRRPTRRTVTRPRQILNGTD
jgi:hypothetical protein